MEKYRRSNKRFLLNNIPISNIYEFSKILEIDTLPIEKCIDFILMLCSGYNLSHFSDPINFIKNRIDNIIESKKEQIFKPNRILILCADDNSFLEEKFKRILNSVQTRYNFLNYNLEDYDIYYIGVKLTECLPFRINGTIEKIDILDKFDVILSEHCPFFAFNLDVQTMIISHLKSNSYFITPNYNLFNFNEVCYLNAYSDSDYKVYKLK